MNQTRPWSGPDRTNDSILNHFGPFMNRTGLDHGPNRNENKLYYTECKIINGSVYISPERTILWWIFYYTAGTDCMTQSGSVRTVMDCFDMVCLCCWRIGIRYYDLHNMPVCTVYRYIVYSKCRVVCVYCIVLRTVSV